MAKRKLDQKISENASDPVRSVNWADQLLEHLATRLDADELAVLKTQAAELKAAPAPPLPPDPTMPAIVMSKKALAALATKVAKAEFVVVDLETSGLDPRAGEIVGIGLAIDDSTYYVPVNHLREADNKLVPGQLTLIEVLTALKLESKRLVNQNVKYEMRWLRHHGKIECRFAWDTMLAARLLRSDLEADLKKVACRELDVPEWDLSKEEKKRLRYLAINTVAAYCAKDCWYTLQLYLKQTESLGLNHFVMTEVEMPLIDVVLDMEDAGYPIDAEFFYSLRARLEPEVHALQGHIQALANDLGLPAFNANSPDQVSALLYDVLKLPIFKRTEKDNPSTDKVVLSRYASKHPIIAAILESRKLAKIISTYCPIPDQLGIDGRFRVEFNQLAADTGRFSSPSVIQTVPKKGDPFEIRKGFRAREGWKIVKADFEQQELRILAQVSGDEGMRVAIAKKTDLHGLAAVKVYKLDCEPNDVKTKYPVQREAIKSIQFGLIYGRTAYSIADELDTTKEDAEALISDYFRQFPTVKQFIDQVHARVLRDGYIDDLFGRRRYLPDALLKLQRKRYTSMSEEEKRIFKTISAAKREAQNFVIQGAAATITKLAMIRCHDAIKSRFLDDVLMILTLHDEQQFEARDHVVEPFANMLPDLMCNLGLERFGFTVPMAVEVQVGPSWGETTKWKGSQHEVDEKG